MDIAPLAAIALLAGIIVFCLAARLPGTLTLETTMSGPGAYRVKTFFRTEKNKGRHYPAYSFVGLDGGGRIYHIPLPRAPLENIRISLRGIHGPCRYAINSIRFDSWFTHDVIAGDSLKDLIDTPGEFIKIENREDVLSATFDGAQFAGRRAPTFRIKHPPDITAVPLRYRFLLAGIVAAAVFLFFGARSFSMKSAGNLVTAIVIIALSVAVFAWCFGTAHVLPTDVRWLMEVIGGDRPTYYLAWSFFRQTPWTFPPGLIPNYLAPLGTSLGSTDALPLFAFLLKPFSSILPDDFQYFGIWLLACFMLQGYFGLLLMRSMTEKKTVQILGALLFLASPPLLARREHLALNAHWLVLAALYLHMAPRKGPTGHLSRIAQWGALVFLSSLIQPYFTGMLLLLFFAWIVRAVALDGKMKALSAAGSALGVTAGAFMGMFLAGNFKGIDTRDYGYWFKLHSANLNTLVNSQGLTLFQKSFDTRMQGHGQYEGFNYLGAGLVILGLISMGTLLARFKTHIPSKRSIPLLAALLLLALYSFSNEITLGQYTIFSYAVPEPFKVVTNGFRTCARFFWPVYYAAVYVILLILIRREKSRELAWILGLACLIQFADISPLRHTYEPRGYRRITSQAYSGPLKSPEWERLFTRFERFVMYPPFMRTYAQQDDYKDFAYLAAKHGRPITVGYVARNDPASIAEVVEDLQREFGRGCKPGTLYVMGSQGFNPLAGKEACEFREIDGYTIAFSRMDREPG